ncbi:hypothetical protein [Leuconostoc citreum]|uniref:hypothetical protein n=1 Tax=Leuconostoc citreum TaxID=33964 RepID=UPI0012BA381F|nr:hypothetical protein [Leuconostoc citreum]QGN59903.1 hypothetical protein GJ636_00105 [Leuconostoc citreum]
MASEPVFFNQFQVSPKTFDMVFQMLAHVFQMLFKVLAIKSLIELNILLTDFNMLLNVSTTKL